MLSIDWLGQWPVERIAYEPTGTYALEQALGHMPCVKLDPEGARRFAQATGTPAKIGRMGAILLARMAATLQPPASAVQSGDDTQRLRC